MRPATGDDTKTTPFIEKPEKRIIALDTPDQNRFAQALKRAPQLGKRRIVLNRMCA